jgi:single-strand DNA-binding protein
LNKFIGLGNLTKDPELKEIKSGKSVCTFSIAINNKVNNSVTYIDVETWNKSAQNCSRFLSKGRKVLIEGRLQLNTWQSQSGESRTKLFCVADLVTFLDKSENQDSSATQESKTVQQIEEDEFADIPF